MFRGLTTFFLVVLVVGYFAIEGLKSTSSRAVDAGLQGLSDLGENAAESAGEWTGLGSASETSDVEALGETPCATTRELRVSVPAGYTQANLRSAPDFSAGLQGTVDAGKAVHSCGTVVRRGEESVNTWHLVTSTPGGEPVGWVHADVLVEPAH